MSGVNLLSPAGRKSGSRARARWPYLAAWLLVLVMPAVAVAYTLVMKDGRRIEIPSRFTVTETAVVYEAGPGINVTVQLANIDVAATERANGEQPGSFSKRISASTEARPAPAPQKPSEPEARRTVTNKELEAARQARIAGEQDYDRTHAERGLPSREELQRLEEERDRKLGEMAQQLAADRAAAQYEALRAEISALNSQINALSTQLAQSPAIYGNYYNYYPPFGFYPYVYPLPILNVVVRSRFNHRPFIKPPPGPGTFMFGRGLNLQPPVLRAGPSLAPARPMPQIVMPRR